MQNTNNKLMQFLLNHNKTLDDIDLSSLSRFERGEVLDFMSGYNIRQSTICKLAKILNANPEEISA